MLTSQFNNVLFFKNKLDGSTSKDRISYRKFQMSAKTMESIVQAGL